ncbi:MAG: hypothetical protein ACE5GV_02270 [Candidatus Scalindua sp.]
MSQKNVYIDELQEQLDKWNEEIYKLEAKVSEAKGDDKLPLKEHIEELCEKRDVVQAKLDELIKEEAEELWEDLKDGATKALDSLKELFEKG